MLAYCKHNGIGVIPWSPLAGGKLARPVTASETARSKLFSSIRPKGEDPVETEIVNRVDEVAKKRGWTMSQVALAWVKRSVSSPIVGMNAIKRVEESIVGGELTDEEAKYLEEP